jgi:hypothetical protein
MFCKHCPNVTKLMCSVNFTEAEYRLIAQAWPDLAHIDASLNDHVGLSEILSTCRHLCDLHIRGSYQDDCEYSVIFRTLGANLRHFRSTRGLWGRETIDTVAECCSQLRTFLFDHDCLAGDDTLAILAEGCPLLESIDLRYCRSVTAQGILALARRRRLRELIPSNEALSPYMDDAAEMEEVIRLSPLLQKLAVSLRYEPVMILRTVAAHLPRLVSLVFTGPRYGESLMESEEAELVRMLQVLVHLEKLRCSFLLSDVVLITLGTHCPHLRELVYPYSHAVTDIGICALARGCPQLSLLDALINAPVTATGVNELKMRCPDLWGVDIGNRLSVDGGPMPMCGSCYSFSL